MISTEEPWPVFGKGEMPLVLHVYLHGHMPYVKITVYEAGDKDLMCARMHAKSLKLCPTLCDPMDCSTPSSSVHGILQARILEWVAMPSSRESSQPRD